MSAALLSNSDVDTPKNHPKVAGIVTIGKLILD